MTPYTLARRFKGIKEIKGPEHSAQILAILQRAASWVKRDEVAWCSAFVNYIMWLMDLPQTNHLRARSWLRVGEDIPIEYAHRGWDVVILTRAGATMDPTVINASGHVGFYVRHDDNWIWVLGGNQSDSVNIRRLSRSRLLGVRRIM
jgi:uncharacterized protein (TIGR02594 family)